MRGRPKNSAKKTSRLNVRLDDDLMADLEYLASGNISSYVRELLSGKKEEKPIVRKETPKAEPKEEPKEEIASQNLIRMAALLGMDLKALLGEIEKAMDSGSIVYDNGFSGSKEDLDTRDFIEACKSMKKNPQSVLDAYTATIRR